DPARRQYRHHWLNAARRFELVAGKYRESPRAPEALLAASELLEELGQLSGRSEDLDRAAGDLKKLIDGYPKHPASVVALLRLSRLHRQRSPANQRAGQSPEQPCRPLALERPRDAAHRPPHH